MKKKILITGGSGLLAVNWALSIRDKCSVVLLLHHKKISISGIDTEVTSLNSLDQCCTIIKKHKPDLVIHTAGLTNVEMCEQDPKLAHKVNVDLAENIAVACNELNIKLVHISTDHLFSGENQMSSEDSCIEPVNNYAKTKHQGELKVQERCKNALIVRTNFFGWGTKYRQSLSDFILNRLRNNKPVELFKDVFFTPILIDELVKKVNQLIDLDVSGIFNVVGKERLSKFDFGVKLAERFKLNLDLINGISIDDKSKLTKRPRDMSLSNAKLGKVLQSEISSFDEQLHNLKEQEGGDSNPIEQVTLKVIPYGRHYIDEDDVEAVTDVLRNGMITQGPKVTEFENIVANYVGAKYAVAVSSGTAALHLACMVLELGKGDEVITSPNTFVATSNSILYVGAKPVFVDIDEQNLNIDIEKIEQVITNSKNIKAIFPVHFGGFPCDMDQIKKLADKYNLRVVEDASHALGAEYNNGNKVGNCQYSNMTIFSFHPVKGVTAGEGGMITTNDPLLYQKLTLLRSHGITKGNFEFPGISKADNSLINKRDALEDGELKRWYYEMQFLGYNYRITDIQCALAVSQMDKLDSFIAARRLMAKFYDKAFDKMPYIKPLQTQARDCSSHHIYVVAIDFKKIGLTRNQFMKKLSDQGVGSQVHYIPVVNQPYYQELGYKNENLSNVNNYYMNALSIPLFFGLTELEQKLVISSISQVLTD
jgi:perosamine synthetase